MKIAYVYDAVYPYIKGGAEKRIYEIGKRLAARGHEVHWYCVKWWEGDDIVQQDGITLHGVCKVNGLYTKEGRRSIREAIYFGWKVFKPLLKGHFDIIDICNFPYFSCFSATLASKINNTPSVITWHEVWKDYWHHYLGLMGYLGKATEALASRLPSIHIAVSARTKSDLLSIGARNIQVTPNGIDFEKIQEIPKAKEKSDVTFAGRLIKEKNVDALLKAISKIKDEMPIKCKIIGDGPEFDRLVALSEKLGLRKNVKFLGFLDYEDVIAHMKASKLFVLPSSREGFGIVLLESMACGTPVIAVRAEKSAASSIVNGNNGILCEMGELKNSILMVLKDENLRNGLSRAGFEYSRSFDWGEITKKTITLYESILQCK
jgi:glycosyltransferase involved in cell wall biosynthesis